MEAFEPFCSNIQKGHDLDPFSTTVELDNCRQLVFRQQSQRRLICSNFLAKNNDESLEVIPEHEENIDLVLIFYNLIGNIAL